MISGHDSNQFSVIKINKDWKSRTIAKRYLLLSKYQNLIFALRPHPPSQCERHMGITCNLKREVDKFNIDESAELDAKLDTKNHYVLGSIKKMDLLKFMMKLDIYYYLVLKDTIQFLIGLTIL